LNPACLDEQGGACCVQAQPDCLSEEARLKAEEEVWWWWLLWLAGELDQDSGIRTEPLALRWS